MDTTIDICIGTEPKTSIPCKVLMYSIREHTEVPIRFHLMEGKHWEKRIGNNPEGTGFSLLRWDIPAFFGYKGYAIYLDADQLVFGDIQSLYNYRLNMGLGCVTCTYQKDKWFKTDEPNTSVMILDNAKCHNDPNWLDGEKLRSELCCDTNRKKYVRVMHAHHLSMQPARLPVEWNSLNTMVSGATKLIHYTKEDQQPWYKPSHQFAQIWGEALKRTFLAGLITAQEIVLEVGRFKPHSGNKRGRGLHPYWMEYLKSGSNKSF